MRLSVIIPVFNERNTIKEIVRRVLNVPIDKEVIIIDDYSTDGTRAILNELLNSHTKPSNLRVIFQPENRGKGAAVRRGLKLASGEYIIIQDADLEYDPQEYLNLVDALGKDGVDVVYGSRFKGEIKKIMKSHYLGNRFLTGFFNLLYGTKFSDMETCYKLFPREFAQKVEIKSDGFGFEPEVTSKLLKEGYKIAEVPITYNGRTFEEGKKINWKHGIDTVFAMVRFRFLN